MCGGRVAHRASHILQHLLVLQSLVFVHAPANLYALVPIVRCANRRQLRGKALERSPALLGIALFLLRELPGAPVVMEWAYDKWCCALAGVIAIAYIGREPDARKAMLWCAQQW